MTKKYEVLVPIAGCVIISVEADNEEEAVDKAFERGFTDDDIFELEMYTSISDGNVLRVSYNDIEVNEV